MSSLLVFGSARLAVLLTLAMAHHVCGAVTDCFKSVHISRGGAARAAAIDGAVGLGLAVPTAVLFFCSSSDVTLYAACYAVGGIVGLLVAQLITPGLPPLTVQPPRAWMDLLRESTPYFLEAVIITAYFRLTVVLVYNLESPAASAVFSTGQSLGLLLGIIPINAGLAALPRIVDAARTSPAALDDVMRLIWQRLVPLGLLTTIVACATAQWWLGWILGPKSGGVWIHFVLFGASRLAVFVSVPAIFALDALRRQSLRVRVAVIAGLSVAGIGLPLLLSFGAVGMSAYLAVLEVAIAVAYVCLLRRNRSLAGGGSTIDGQTLPRDPGSALTESMK